MTYWKMEGFSCSTKGCSGVQCFSCFFGCGASLWLCLRNHKHMSKRCILQLEALLRLQETAAEDTKSRCKDYFTSHLCSFCMPWKMPGNPPQYLHGGEQNKTKAEKACLLAFSLLYVVTRAELKHTGKDPEAPPTALALILPDAYIAWEQLYQSFQSHQLCSHKLRTRQRFANAACHS